MLDRSATELVYSSNSIPVFFGYSKLKDIAFQFFFENQPVASIDSFINNQPSLFAIESIEPSSIISISKDSFEKLYQACPNFYHIFGFAHCEKKEVVCKCLPKN